MKKIMCVLVSFVLLIMYGCSSYDTSTWQTIVLEKYWQLKLPSEWNYYIEDEVHYIVDSENNPVMISFEDDGNSLYFEDLEECELVASEGFSNSAIYAKSLYEYKGGEDELYSIALNGVSDNGKELDLEFVFWDKSIKENVIIEIAKSFRSN